VKPGDPQRPALGDEELLAELLWLAPGDPRRRELLAARPELAARLEDLERTAEHLAVPLRGAAETQARSLAAVSAGEDLERRTLDALRQALGAGGGETSGAPSAARAGAAPRRPRGRLWVAATAAAAAGLLWSLWPEDTEPPPGDRTFWLHSGPAGFEATPAGPQSDFSRFQWSVAPSPGSVQRVRLWPGDAASGPPLLESPDRTEPHWTPAGGQLIPLGDHIRWRVVELNPVSGEQRTVLEVSARRGP
jgi:hypothetical protein